MSGFNTIIIKKGIRILFKLLGVDMQASLQMALKDWYKKTLETASAVDDTVARTLCWLFDVNLDDQEPAE